MPVDESRPFIPIGIAILTVSDSRTEVTDRSGALLCERVKESGHHLIERRIVRDDHDSIVSVLHEWVEQDAVHAVIVTGGTGITGRDVTPEAVRAVCDKDIPGFGELFRWLSYEKIGTSTIQSRALAGLAKRTFIFAIPGSTNACRDAWDMILAQQLDARHRPCNFVELIPRLSEV